MCGTADASIYRQGLGEFFLMIPIAMKRRGLCQRPKCRIDCMRCSATATASPRFISNRTASSATSGRKIPAINQWALETLALAMDGEIRSRAQAQTWLRYKNYQPTTLTLGPLTRLGGRISAANVAFDDHPNEKAVLRPH